MSQKTDPLVLAVIAAGAALVGAVIAAYTAGRRQKRQLGHNLLLQTAQLSHDLSKHKEQLRNARVLEALDDRRGALDQAVELLLRYRERAVIGLRMLSKTPPSVDYQNEDELPALDRFTRSESVTFRGTEARLALRFGDDGYFVCCFREARDQLHRASDLITRGCEEVSGQDADCAREAVRDAVNAFGQAAHRALIEGLSDEPEKAPVPEITSRQG